MPFGYDIPGDYDLPPQMRAFVCLGRGLLARGLLSLRLLGRRLSFVLVAGLTRRPVSGLVGVLFPRRIVGLGCRLRCGLV